MILTFEHGEVRELRLNRPPVNALSPELIATLSRAVQVAPWEGKRRADTFGVTWDVLGRTRRTGPVKTRSAGEGRRLA